MLELKPGLGKPDLTDDQLELIRYIAARVMASKILSNIDPLTGVLPTVFPTGFNRQQEFEVRIEVFPHPDRLENGEDRANAIADQVKVVVGYPVRVWAAMGGTFFYGDSERPDPEE